METLNSLGLRGEGAGETSQSSPFHPQPLHQRQVSVLPCRSYSLAFESTFFSAFESSWLSAIGARLHLHNPRITAPQSTSMSKGSWLHPQQLDFVPTCSTYIVWIVVKRSHDGFHADIWRKASCNWRKQDKDTWSRIPIWNENWSHWTI